MRPAIFFDLDDTLYAPGTGVMGAISQRITEFVMRQYGKTEVEAEALRTRWRDRYGTALRGMREEGYRFDPDSYFAFVHDVPLDTIAPAPSLRDAVLALDARRIVLTNADANHAWRVLWRLGLEDCFERVIDIKSMGFVNKPHLEAYALAQSMTGADSRDCVLLDDIPANTRGAMAAGWRAILVAPRPEADAAHWTAPDIDGAIAYLANGLPRPPER